MSENAGTEQTEKAPAKIPTPKPLGIQQRRDLTKLIDGEFESLKGELNVFANELRMRRQQTIEQEYEEQEREARQIEAEWMEFAQGLRRQADEWLQRKREQGFTLMEAGRYGEPPIRVNSIRIGIPAKDRALKEVDNVVSHQKMTAVQGLERQRIQLQKDLLLEGLVSDKAKEFLAKMPNPRELLAQVMEGARGAGLLGPAAQVQQIEAAVVRHDHGDPQAVHIGEILE